MLLIICVRGVGSPSACDCGVAAGGPLLVSVNRTLRCDRLLCDRKKVSPNSFPGGLPSGFTCERTRAGASARRVWHNPFGALAQPATQHTRSRRRGTREAAGSQHPKGAAAERSPSGPALTSARRPASVIAAVERWGVVFHDAANPDQITAAKMWLMISRRGAGANTVRYFRAEHLGQGVHGAYGFANCEPRSEAELARGPGAVHHADVANEIELGDRKGAEADAPGGGPHRAAVFLSKTV